MRFKYLFVLLSAAAICVWAAILVLPDNNLHVVVCDVGQGDAILVTHQTTQILVDVGLNSKVLDCLAEYTPFYDRTIEQIIITHPQHDHMGGISDVLASYTVMGIVIPPVENQVKAYSYLREVETAGKVEIRNFYKGDVMRVGELRLQGIWPTRSFVADHAEENSQVLGWKTDGTDLNHYSIVTRLTFGEFDMLLTGDADHGVQLAQVETGLLTDVEVLKVPHHGGKDAVLSEWLSHITPEVAVISVGKDNSYGHPRQTILDILSNSVRQILRTDQEGSIEIVSDGKTYWVK